VKRRLYFLLPEAGHTRSVVNELETDSIEQRCMHVIATQGVDLNGLPFASHNQRNDLGARLEAILWGGNLALFFIALLVLTVLALLHVSWFWLLLPVAVMLAAFVTGVEFAKYLPNVHLSEFTVGMNRTT